MNPRAVHWLLAWHEYATWAHKARTVKAHMQARTYALHARTCLDNFRLTYSETNGRKVIT